MSIIDNTLASKVDTFNPATPLMQAATIQNAQAEAQANQFKMKQAELGAEVRGLQPYLGTPEFASKWAETSDRLLQRGVLDPQTHEKWRNSPSPLLMKSIIAQTSDPTLDFRKQEAQREQANTNRTFANQDRQFAFTAEQAKEKPVIQKLKVGEDEHLFQIKPNGEVRKLDTGEAAPGNPFGGGKFNETQGKAAGFTDRMLQSEAVLAGGFPINGGEGPPTPAMDMSGTNSYERAKTKLPGAGTYYNPSSPEFQKYEQAKRDFINAQLRRESGAVISPSEFDSAEKQYFPAPGDTQEVIAQKRANRRAAVEALGREGGPSYRPKATYGTDGTVTPYKPAAKAGSAPQASITKAEFYALPPGSPFTAPDGSQRIKP